MQLCDCEVRIADSAGHTVIKNNVTPAEIIILKAIHGASAVVNIQPTKMDKRPHGEEWERLTKAYGRAPDGLMDAGNGDLLEKLFPGAQKNLPVSLKDIGLGHLIGGRRSEPEQPVVEDDNGEDS